MSFLSKGALISLGNTEKDKPEEDQRRSRHHQHPPKQRAPPKPHRRLADANSSLDATFGAEANGVTPSLDGLEGGREVLALVANGTSLEQAKKRLFSRKGVNLAMGAVRKRILQEGLCGVQKGAPSCVGAWCKAKEWGGMKPAG